MHLVRFLVVVVGISLYPSLVHAESPEGALARLSVVEGEVTLRRQGGTSFDPATLGTELNVGDTVHTARRARAALEFRDGVVLQLAPNSSLLLRAPDDAGGAEQTKLELKEGTGLFSSWEPRRAPLVVTPAVTTAVRGTEFAIEVSPTGTRVAVFDGAVTCFNAQGEVGAQRGELVLTATGSEPKKTILSDPVGMVQWALSTPVAFSDELLSQTGSADVVQSLSHGEYRQALNSLEASGGRSAGQRLLLAAVLLSSGESAEAQQQLLLACGQAQSCSKIEEEDFLSLSLLHALVRNELNTAQKFATSLASARPNALKSMALATLAQRSGEIDQAEQWVEQGLKVSPQSRELRVRLAEILLAKADYDGARAQIDLLKRDASGMDAYVLELEGFLALSEDAVGEALRLFTEATVRQPRSALGHFGLGLSQIRQGDVEAGRKQLALAVVLEPQHALYRSYLAKAFFEEDRYNLAERELQRAIEIDPEDPTPYLYRAYNRLAQQSPVAALRDVEASIARNNNRAVYRSRSALDQDRGVRSASLAEVFGVLGFNEVARTEAVRSLIADPQNYSAHALLGRSYSAIAVSDAGVSEQRLARIMAPPGFNLLRSPSTRAGFNEYNALFDRSMDRGALGLDYQSDGDVLAPSAVLSGRGENTGYAVSYEPLFAGGSRHGEYAYVENARGALQYALTSSDAFLLEGEMLTRDEENPKAAPDAIDRDEYALNASYRHAFSPLVEGLIDVRHENRRSSQSTSQLERPGLIREVQDGEESYAEDLFVMKEFARERVRSTRVTAQTLARIDQFSITAGAEYYSNHPEREEWSSVIEDAEGYLSSGDFAFRSAGYSTNASYAAYVYTQYRLSEDWALQLGGNYTDLQLERREITPFAEDTSRRAHVSPKLGLVWAASTGLTARAAYFESLRKSSLEDSGDLETTLVGGINQRFTDLAGTRSRNYGVGLDYKLEPAATYFGVEALHRDVVYSVYPALSSVDVDYDESSVSTGAIVGDRSDEHRDVDEARFYAYHVWTDSWVSGLEYLRSGNQATAEAPDNQVLDLQRVRGTLQFLDTSGVFAFARATWRLQERRNSYELDDGGEAFWLFDVGLGYRLPKRAGVLSLELNNLLGEHFDYDQSFGVEEFVTDDFSLLLKARFEF